MPSPLLIAPMITQQISTLRYPVAKVTNLHTLSKIINIRRKIKADVKVLHWNFNTLQIRRPFRRIRPAVWTLCVVVMSHLPSEKMEREDSKVCAISSNAWVNLIESTHRRADRASLLSKPHQSRMLVLLSFETQLRIIACLLSLEAISPKFFLQ